MTTEVSIVDVTNIGIDKETYEKCEGKRIGDMILEALCKTGFVHLLNTGITHDKIEHLNKVAMNFFALPEEIKCKFNRTESVATRYSPINSESLASGKRLNEIRESCNLQDIEISIYDDIPELWEVVKETIPIMKKLSFRLLSVLEMALDLEPGFLVSKHKLLCSKDNPSCLRILHYPPIKQSDDINKENTIRISAHTDFGTGTLLIQDSVGGLELQNENGEWIPAKPIKGAVLLNAADLLQRWTSNKVKSAMHRVPFPENDDQRNTRRQSMTFFIAPDDDVMVEPIDGSCVYEPIRSIDYITYRERKLYT